ncbi:PREDICTED: pulmonary surfactant-associated protein D-like, partial [Chinchilla lanigera]|uniref:pulmonary surfactant-associated protein D-like n=1 Tax=Chinchilla lanigera TaxID=34839 RepID=UPI000697C3D4
PRGRAPPRRPGLRRRASRPPGLATGRRARLESAAPPRAATGRRGGSGSPGVPGCPPCAGRSGNRLAPGSRGVREALRGCAGRVVLATFQSRRGDRSKRRCGRGRPDGRGSALLRCPLGCARAGTAAPWGQEARGSFSRGFARGFLACPSGAWYPPVSHGLPAWHPCARAPAVIVGGPLHVTLDPEAAAAAPQHTLPDARERLPFPPGP